MNYKKVARHYITVIENEFILINQEPTDLKVKHAYLLASWKKAKQLYNAINILCNKKQNDEALIILRSLIEHSINMRWITEDDSNKRLQCYLDDLVYKDIGSNWTKVRLDKRMAQIGFQNRDYFDFCVKVTYSFAHVNASTLKWEEVYTNLGIDNDTFNVKGIYQVIIQMLGHIMKASNNYFPSNFLHYEEAWNKIKGDEEIRKKYNRLKENLQEQLNNKEI